MSSETQNPPNDLTLLGMIGKAMEGGVAQVIVSATFYGVFLLLFSVSIVTFILRKTRTPASYITLGTTILTFLLATLDLAGRIVSVYLVTSNTLRNDSNELPLTDKVSIANEKLIYPNIVAEWTTSTAMMISDLVVIWRLWTVIPEQRKRATIVPILFYIFSSGLTLSYLSRISSPKGIQSVVFGQAPYLLFALSITFSLATNVVTTSIFGFKLWRFRSFLLQNGTSGAIDVSGTRKRLENILLLLIESGLFYCILQIIYLALGFVQFNSATGRLGQKIYDVTYFSLSAIYPTLVVVLVNTQRSLADNLRRSRLEDNAVREATLNHISFAPVASSPSESRPNSPTAGLPSKAAMTQTRGVLISTQSAPY